MKTISRKMNQAVELEAGTDITTAGVALNAEGRDLILIVENTDDTDELTLTLTDGGGIQGQEMEFVIEAETTVVIRPETGMFKQIVGENKGCFVLKGSATGLKAQLIEI